MSLSFYIALHSRDAGRLLISLVKSIRNPKRINQFKGCRALIDFTCEINKKSEKDKPVQGMQGAY